MIDYFVRALLNHTNALMHVPDREMGDLLEKLEEGQTKLDECMEKFKKDAGSVDSISYIDVIKERMTKLLKTLENADGGRFSNHIKERIKKLLEKLDVTAIPVSPSPCRTTASRRNP